MSDKPVRATDIPLPAQNTIYPAPFAAIVAGRAKRKLGNHFGLTNFGVNLTRLEPGSASALLHHHSRQDEFIYILEGTLTLRLGTSEEHTLHAGDCMGCKHGNGVAHQLVNRSSESATYLEIGDRTAGDEVEYPEDDLKATMTAEGTWSLSHKDGRPY